jgi:hypothetical protein
MDYLKVTKKEVVNVPKEEVKKVGCVYITKDKKSNKLTYECIVPVSRPKPISLQPLVNHWEKRKMEYIELYGEDRYNEVFLCKNYDYEYFDKMDMIDLSMEECESEENSDYDEYE